MKELVGVKGSLNLLDRSELLKISTALGKKLRQVEHERVELKKFVSDGQAARQQYHDQQHTLLELQDAHVAQAKEMQKLQKQYGKVKIYQNTIAMQEKVIAKMQSVVETRMKHVRNPSSGGQYDGDKASVPEYQEVGYSCTRVLQHVKST